ncbi:SapC family protein [Parasphingopyxis marina]|uniref:SapC family protein n=1 Tax=Parasphingopyxis marina TaxID=2761622 RepID=A0A842I1Z7_9SPHN|nr:SapC family protein [Parasphingopyxis marina]MBC2778260.1 SapC family protein [Parasphingopyxis marina]
MASAAPQQNFPLLYNDVVPLSSQQHGNYKLQIRPKLPFLTGTHAVPVTIDEFVVIQRYMPIVFSSGENPVPLALMGLNQGVNVFLNDDGTLIDGRPVYMPAYVRRYPFLLARLTEESQELSLCFDPTTDIVGEHEEGDPLFEGADASQTTKDLLGFCEQVETSGHRTVAFVKELQDADLLMEGEVSIDTPTSDKPFVYRGFQMVNEEKLKELRGDQARKFVQNGIMPLIYAHMMSLQLVRDIFAMQLQQGKVPPQPDANVPQGVVEPS